jgi:uncharacterized membrane protein YedE/YeeE
MTLNVFERVLWPLFGGALIGLAISLMLLFNGRVTGVSGILKRFLTDSNERGWRGLFLGGLFAGGLFLRFLSPATLEDPQTRGWVWLVLAGWLVGFGTVLGNGCTSGHGICGISRLSVRSMLATLVFMGFGVLSATLFRIFVLEAK